MYNPLTKTLFITLYMGIPLENVSLVSVRFLPNLSWHSVGSQCWPLSDENSSHHDHVPLVTRLGGCYPGLSSQECLAGSRSEQPAKGGSTDVDCVLVCLLISSSFSCCMLHFHLEGQTERRGGGTIDLRVQSANLGMQ